MVVFTKSLELFYAIKVPMFLAAKIGLGKALFSPPFYHSHTSRIDGTFWSCVDFDWREGPASL